MAQIKEDGIQRQMNASLPNYPYPAPNQAALPSPSVSSYVNFQYYYEGLGTVLGNPQLTARVMNGVGTSADQYDFALITDNDVAKFNLARLDATGVAGVRNVEVEGDLLTTITAAAQAFFGLPNNQGGVQLPLDNLAGVEIRDYAPPKSILAKSIQGVAFGSTTRFTVNHIDLRKRRGGVRRCQPARAGHGHRTGRRHLPRPVLRRSEPAARVLHRRRAEHGLQHIRQ